MDTILDKIHARAIHKPDSIAVMYKEDGVFREVKWKEFFRRIQFLARVLDQWGLKPGDRAAIQCGTRWEWTVCDMAVTMMGGIMVPVYPQLPDEEARYILEHCGARFVFCEDAEQLGKIRRERSKLPDIQRIVVIDAPEDVSEEEEVFANLLREGGSLGEGRDHLIEERLAAIHPDDPMTIVYTSGTTGPPKGAVLACRGFEFNTDAVSRFISFAEGNRTIAYLPLAHVYERFVEIGALSRGVIYCYAESLEKLAENLSEIKPHLMPGVPRVYEKIHAGMMAKLDAAPPLKRRLATWALGVGRDMFETRTQGRSPGLGLSLSHAIADRLIFSKIRQKLGGCLESAVVAAAPVSPDLCAFFQGLGIPMVEGWGMTETTAPATLSPKGRVKVGTAGIPFEGLDLKIAEDGEVLVKGPTVMKGYYRNEEATRETFDENGYLMTGDLGEIDEDGYLKIVGRKKDIVINSYGKNIAARNIEDKFMDDPMFSGCVVFGDGKKYLTAVVCLSPESNLDPLAADTRGAVQVQVEAINGTLPRFEQVKGFVISDHEFSVETGEITPTLKVKRSQVINNNLEALEALYTD